MKKHIVVLVSIIGILGLSAMETQERIAKARSANFFAAIKELSTRYSEFDKLLQDQVQLAVEGKQKANVDDELVKKLNHGLIRAFYMAPPQVLHDQNFEGVYSNLTKNILGPLARVIKDAHEQNQLDPMVTPFLLELVNGIESLESLIAIKREYLAQPEKMQNLVNKVQNELDDEVKKLQVDVEKAIASARELVLLAGKQELYLSMSYAQKFLKASQSLANNVNLDLLNLNAQISSLPFTSEFLQVYKDIQSKFYTINYNPFQLYEFIGFKNPFEGVGASLEDLQKMVQIKLQGLGYTFFEDIDPRKSPEGFALRELRSHVNSNVAKSTYDTFILGLDLSAQEESKRAVDHMVRDVTNQSQKVSDLLVRMIDWQANPSSGVQEDAQIYGDYIKKRLPVHLNRLQKEFDASKVTAKTPSDELPKKEAALKSTLQDLNNLGYRTKNVWRDLSRMFKDYSGQNNIYAKFNIEKFEPSVSILEKAREQNVPQVEQQFIESIFKIEPMRENYDQFLYGQQALEQIVLPEPALKKIKQLQTQLLNELQKVSALQKKVLEVPEREKPKKPSIFELLKQKLGRQKPVPSPVDVEEMKKAPELGVVQPPKDIEEQVEQQMLAVEKRFDDLESAIQKRAVDPELAAEKITELEKLIDELLEGKPEVKKIISKTDLEDLKEKKESLKELQTQLQVKVVPKVPVDVSEWHTGFVSDGISQTLTQIKKVAEQATERGLTKEDIENDILQLQKDALNLISRVPLNDVMSAIKQGKIDELVVKREVLQPLFNARSSASEALKDEGLIKQQREAMQAIIDELNKVIDPIKEIAAQLFVVHTPQSFIETLERQINEGADQKIIEKLVNDFAQAVIDGRLAAESRELLKLYKKVENIAQTFPEGLAVRGTLDKLLKSIAQTTFIKNITDEYGDRLFKKVRKYNGLRDEEDIAEAAELAAEIVNDIKAFSQAVDRSVIPGEFDYGPVFKSLDEIKKSLPVDPETERLRTALDDLTKAYERKYTEEPIEIGRVPERVLPPRRPAPVTEKPTPEVTPFAEPTSEEKKERAYALVSAENRRWIEKVNNNLPKQIAKLDSMFEKLKKDVNRMVLQQQEINSVINKQGLLPADVAKLKKYHQEMEKLFGFDGAKQQVIFFAKHIGARTERLPESLKAAWEKRKLLFEGVQINNREDLYDIAAINPGMNLDAIRKAVRSALRRKLPLDVNFNPTWEAFGALAFANEVAKENYDAVTQRTGVLEWIRVPEDVKEKMKDILAELDQKPVKDLDDAYQQQKSFLRILVQAGWDSVDMVAKINAKVAKQTAYIRKQFADLQRRARALTDQKQKIITALNKVEFAQTPYAKAEFDLLRKVRDEYVDLVGVQDIQRGSVERLQHYIEALFMRNFRGENKSYFDTLTDDLTSRIPDLKAAQKQNRPFTTIYNMYQYFGVSPKMTPQEISQKIVREFPHGATSAVARAVEEVAALFLDDPSKDNYQTFVQLKDKKPLFNTMYRIDADLEKTLIKMSEDLFRVRRETLKLTFEETLEGVNYIKKIAMALDPVVQRVLVEYPGHLNQVTQERRAIAAKMKEVDGFIKKTVDVLERYVKNVGTLPEMEAPVTTAQPAWYMPATFKGVEIKNINQLKPTIQTTQFFLNKEEQEVLKNLIEEVVLARQRGARAFDLADALNQRRHTNLFAKLTNDYLSVAKAFDPTVAKVINMYEVIKDPLTQKPIGKNATTSYIQNVIGELVRKNAIASEQAKKLNIIFGHEVRRQTYDVFMQVGLGVDFLRPNETAVQLLKIEIDLLTDIANSLRDQTLKGFVEIATLILNKTRPIEQEAAYSEYDRAARLKIKSIRGNAKRNLSIIAGQLSMVSTLAPSPEMEKVQQVAQLKQKIVPQLKALQKRINVDASWQDEYEDFYNEAQRLKTTDYLDLGRKLFAQDEAQLTRWIESLNTPAGENIEAAMLGREYFVQIGLDSEEQARLDQLNRQAQEIWPDLATTPPAPEQLGTGSGGSDGGTQSTTSQTGESETEKVSSEELTSDEE